MDRELGRLRQQLQHYRSRHRLALRAVVELEGLLIAEGHSLSILAMARIMAILQRLRSLLQGEEGQP
jgi:hypothetical protein